VWPIATDAVAWSACVQWQKWTEGSGGTTLLLYFAFALVYDSRGIEIVNFTTAAALSAGTLMASAGTPYRLVPAHFYPCLCVLPFSVDHDREPCKTDEPIERLFEVGADSQGLKRGPPAFNWL